MKKYFLLISLLLLLASNARATKITVQKTAFTPSGANFGILDTKAALNTQTGESLVIWTHLMRGEPAPIRGRILGPGGVAKTKEFSIVQDPNAFFASVAYNPITNEYLVAYDNNPGGSRGQSDILVVRLDAKGKILGPAEKISNDPSIASLASQFPAALYNPKTGGYMVIWFVHGVGGVPDEIQAAASLNKEGKLIGRMQSILTQKTQRFIRMAAAFPPTGNKLLVIYALRLTDSSGDLWLSVVDPELKSVNPNPTELIKFSASPISVVDRYFLSLTSTIVFMSERSGVIYYPDNNGLRGQPISADGKLNGGSFTAFKSPAETISLRFPAAEFTHTPKGIRGVLIAHELDDSVSIWAQALDEFGKPSDPAIEVATLAPAEKAVSSDMIALIKKPESSSFPFVYFGSITQTAGGFILKMNLTLIP